MCDCLNNRVQLFTNEGVFIGTFGSEGRDDGQFWRPMGVAVDSDDRIIVVDQGTFYKQTLLFSCRYSLRAANYGGRINIYTSTIK